MLLRCFRVDRVYRAITNFVTKRMGEQYVTPPVVSLESVFEQSTPFSPIVFILSPGADPASELGKLAEMKGYGGNRFKFLAMGQGQEKVGHPTNPWMDSTHIYFSLACSSIVGDSLSTWSLADAAELPLADPMAAAAGEGFGEHDQTSPRLQTLAHHCTHL